MALSFEESIAKIMNTYQTPSAPSVASETRLIENVAPASASIVSLNDEAGVASYSIATTEILSENESIAAYSGDFTRSDKYLWYEKYYDDKLSFVDEKKEITVDSSQINLTQESNSQYIPFEMPRFYDGIDLMEMALQIHYVNKNGDEDYSTPINVSYSFDKIRFAWLVGKTATAIEGDVQFELRAVGVNEKGDEYTLITKAAKVNILKSLSGNGIIEPSLDWTNQFITQVNEKIAQAQSAAQEAQSAISTVENYANQAANSATEAQTVVNTAKEELSATVDSSISVALEGYYTKSEVDTLLEEIDLTEVYEAINSIDGLAAFNVEYDESTRVMTFYNGESVIKSITLNSDPSAEWVAAYNTQVDTKISDAVSVVSTSLDEYKTSNDAAVQALDEKIGDLPETLKTDYYTKTETDDLLTDKANATTVSNLQTEVTAISTTASSNTTKIGDLGNKLAELEELVNTLNNSNTGYTYDLTYDLETYTLSILEIENEGEENEVRTVKSAYVIQGGSGGGTSSTLAITYITKTPVVVTTDGTAMLEYVFTGTDSSGDDVGEGTATWKVNGSVVATETVPTGDNSFDVTKYLSIGSQKVVLSITDANGSLATKTWTVQKIDVRLESSFNDKLTYPVGEVSFDYTPYGAISKVVHFEMYNSDYDPTKLDSVEWEEIGTVTTSASGIPMAYTLPAQEHGSYLIRAYMTAEINNSTITSNIIYKDIMWYDAASGLPVISCTQQNFTAKQYDTTNIVYTVYDPSTETPTVTLAIDGIEVSTETMTSATGTWPYKSTDVGTHTLTITCRGVTKTLTATIEELDIDVAPITANLAFDFNPVGYSNNSANRLWTDGTVSMTVSDNFDWTNGGYQIDENGDQYFCIKAGTHAEIDYQLFGDDAKINGKQMKLIFKTRNVADGEATFLECLSDTIGTDKIGIEMKVHEANIYAKTETSSLPLPYAEEEIIEFEFNITSSSEAIPMVMGYEDGVSTRPMVYDNTHDFQQHKDNRKIISLGSPDCDLLIYRFKVYTKSLSDRDILNNFIADARNAEEMIARYERNQIYQEGLLTPEYLAEKCPDLRILKIDCPRFTKDKDDKVAGTTIQCIYKNGDPILDNWIATDCVHSGQGTSSNNYGAAGRNLDLIMKTYKDYGNSPTITLSDGSTVSKVSLTRSSVDVNYFNVKVNIASSENANNACLANRYNTYNPYKRPIIRDSEDEIAKVKDTMEFQNCVIFLRESGDDEHTEFADKDYHFYAIGNIGDSKKTDKTRLTDPNDPYECILEVMDNTLPLSTMPTGRVDESGYPIYPIKPNEWVEGNTAYDALQAELFNETEATKKDNGLADTYGWRYIYEDGTDEKNAEVRSFVEDKWREFYKFIVTSTDEEFRANLGNYCVLDSVMYYYLFTLRYTMTDNHSKNCFWHYGKSNDLDTEGNPIRKWDLCFDYDNDKVMSL